MKIMSKLGMLISVAAVATAVGCSSSTSGGTGGSGGGASAGSGGAAAGTSGSAGATGGAAAGASGSAGATGGGGAAGSSGTGGTGGGSALCGDDTGTGTGDSCNTVVPAGACVTATKSTGTPPTPAGGTFVAGTYNLTAQTIYVAADAGTVFLQTGRQTLVVSAVTASSLTLDQSESSGTAIGRSHGPVAISGMTATFSPTCPVSDGGDNGGTAEFTATATSITLFQETNSGAIQVSVYTKAL